MPDSVFHVLDFLPPLVLLVGVVVGHLSILTVSLNLWYGQPFPKPFLSLMRRLHTLLVPGGLLVLLWLYGFDLRNAWHPAPAGWHVFPALYILSCAAMGFLIFPAITWSRMLRRLPALLLSNHTSTIDIAGRLGYPPRGDGKYRHLTRLPGNEIFRVDFTEKTFHLPRLPAAWDGLTILHLTDVHFCGTPDKRFYFQVMDICRDWQPDILALTGDIVDSPRHHPWVVPVLGRLRWQIAAFAVLGNHDSWFEPERVRKRLRRLGIRVLGNRWEQVDVRGEPLIVVGHEGPWFRPEPDLEGCPAGTFRLCLSHTPDNMPWAKQHGMDLVLAGHNHGGQIRLPGVGSILIPSRFSRRYDCGTFHEPPTLLHVSRGLAGHHPLRYNCRPEVTRIILRSDQEAKSQASG